MIAGCKSSHVDVTVENRTGAPVRLLEVDYPNASFGADVLVPGAQMHYRIQVQGNGPVKVQYTAPDNKQTQATGPELRQDQRGTMQIVLLPEAKVRFQE
jgi:hypothetical protein